jgi:hypothetical protein
MNSEKLLAKGLFCFFSLSGVKCAKTPKIITIDNQRVTKKVKKKCNKIWSVQKNVVPLHPLSLKNGVRPKELKQNSDL